MKHLLLLTIFLTPAICSGQCDSIKRQAVVWVLQRNNALEQVKQLETIDSLNREQIASLRLADSLSRLESTALRSAITGQATIIASQDARIADLEAERDKLRKRSRRRLVLIGCGFVGGVIVGVVVF
jgi:hypothetical protein